MTKTTKPAGDGARGDDPTDEALERALEGLFRLGANRRFDARQAQAVGASVTRAGYAILRSIDDRGTASVREVADAAVMDTATASRQVGSLVDDGLVRRTTASDDARAVELSLTPLGREVYRRIVDHRLDHVRRVTAAWSEPDRRTLTDLVERLTADLASTPVADRGVGPAPG